MILQGKINWVLFYTWSNGTNYTSILGNGQMGLKWCTIEWPHPPTKCKPLEKLCSINDSNLTQQMGDLDMELCQFIESFGS